MPSGRLGVTNSRLLVAAALINTPSTHTSTGVDGNEIVIFAVEDETGAGAGAVSCLGADPWLGFSCFGAEP